MEDELDEEYNIHSEERGCASKVLCNRTGLLLLVVGYVLLGAVLFKTIEGEHDVAVPAQVQKSREDCLKELWLITERLNVLYEKNWTKLVTEQLKRFEREVVDAGRIEGSSAIGTPHWTFGGAVLYTLTLLTTIGYGKLSPRTALGKLLAIFYALIGVPLMLVLLSTLGSLLAGGCRRGYSKLCCKHNVPKSNSVVGYHKAPTNNQPKHQCRTQHDDGSIQIATPGNCYNHAEHPSQQQHKLEPPKRTLLATVRASHARGRCRQLQVRQMLADPQLCPAHAQGMSRNAVGFLQGSDADDPDDGDENEHGMCSHDTPSRVPLICRTQDASLRSPSPLPSSLVAPSIPSVPPTLVLCIFVGYLCVGAGALAMTGWSYLDAIYFCFSALTTIGLGDRFPQHAGGGEPAHIQWQLYAACAYIFLGLVVVAMCFSLVHEEVTAKCKQFVTNHKLPKK